MAESSFARQIRRQAARDQAIRAFVRGLPALLLLVAIGVLLNTANQAVENGETRSRYLRHLDQSLRQSDWEQVQLLSRKLVMLRPDDPLGRFYLALYAAEQQNLARARHLMEHIAPEERTGFAPAHWWLAQNYAGGENLTAADLRRSRRHAQRLLELEPDRADARMLLGRVDLALGQTESAIKQLTQAAEDDPALHLRVARQLAQLHQTELMQVHAKKSAVFYQGQIDNDPHDATARINLADALTLLRQTDLAAEVLKRGLRLGDDHRLREHLAGLCVTMYDSLSNSPTTPGSLRSRVALLAQALDAMPNHAGALLRLAYLSISGESQGGSVAERLQEVLSSGTAPAIVHTILGGHALSQNDRASAQMHFETAHRLEPDSPACLNNLAWALAQHSSADLPRALQLADTAVRLCPNHPEIRETKGQILLMMGHYREALPELELGLNGALNQADIHHSLATIYDELGQPDLAARHRELETTAVRR